jgi:uncharacterized membrane protein YgdD (TMEM256/DUF423 family)
MKTKVIIISILGFLAVGFGAFGAHGLKSRLDEVTLHAYETAVHYHFYHLMALAFLTSVHDKLTVKRFKLLFNLFLIGIFLFSGSLYGICFAKAAGLSLIWLGPVTPIGGIVLMCAWGLLAFTFYKSDHDFFDKKIRP